MLLLRVVLKQLLRVIELVERVISEHDFYTGLLALLPCSEFSSSKTFVLASAFMAIDFYRSKGLRIDYTYDSKHNVFRYYLKDGGRYDGKKEI